MSSNAAPAELLTLKELAALCQVSQRTAWQWATDGTAPPPLKIGKGTVRYSRRAYERWIATGCPRIDGGRNDDE
ncbi:MAG: helix-turn-helix domain-containing protein [Planctomycetaceae bacterium]|nr:helix-turn-helix domain-containing protein [Planctomycetaceae bacterium]